MKACLGLEATGVESWFHSSGHPGVWLGLLILLIHLPILAAVDLAALCADRAAIERVYYHHRTGTKPPFEETLPPDQLRRLVQTDLAKETALKNVYGVEVTPAMLAAEVQRINTTTRAPDILAELKAALGNDTNRFALTVAKPIVVERLLRSRFENDDALHAAQRREAEQVREQLLAVRSSRGHETPSSNSGIEVGLRTSAATNNLVQQLLALLKRGHSNEVSETTWQLGAHPEEKPDAETPDAGEIRKRFGPDAQMFSPSPTGGKERKLYFADLPAELQRVLRVQLRQPGNVSAVIETPGGFLLYLAKEKSETVLTVACLTLPKGSYEQWLNEQPEIP
jgi:GTP cyclohydrolase II